MTDDPIKDQYSRMEATLIAALSAYSDTIETRSAALAVLLMLASGLARAEPPELRRHWAQEFYKHADRLASSETGK